jgi:hypothetical protein
VVRSILSYHNVEVRAPIGRASTKKVPALMDMANSLLNSWSQVQANNLVFLLVAIVLVVLVLRLIVRAALGVLFFRLRHIIIAFLVSVAGGIPAAGLGGVDAIAGAGAVCAKGCATRRMRQLLGLTIPLSAQCAQPADGSTATPAKSADGTEETILMGIEDRDWYRELHKERQQKYTPVDPPNPDPEAGPPVNHWQASDRMAAAGLNRWFGHFDVCNRCRRLLPGPAPGAVLGGRACQGWRKHQRAI